MPNGHSTSDNHAETHNNEGERGDRNDNDCERAADPLAQILLEHLG